PPGSHAASILRFVRGGAPVPRTVSEVSDRDCPFLLVAGRRSPLARGPRTSCGVLGKSRAMSLLVTLATNCPRLADLLFLFAPSPCFLATILRQQKYRINSHNSRNSAGFTELVMQSSPAIS